MSWRSATGNASMAAAATSKRAQGGRHHAPVGPRKGNNARSGFKLLARGRSAFVLMGP